MQKAQTTSKWLLAGAATLMTVLIFGVIAYGFLTRKLSDRMEDVHVGDGEVLQQSAEEIASDFINQLQNTFSVLNGVEAVLSNGTMRDTEKLSAAMVIESLVPESKVYLIAQGGKYRCLDTTKGALADSNSVKSILADGNPALMRTRFSGDTDALLMMKPVGYQSIQGFGYVAIGFGLPIKSAQLLSLKDLQGDVNAFLCTPDGDVLQAAGDNTLSPNNVISYFASQGLDEASVHTLQENMRSGKSGNFPFDNAAYQLYYAPIGFQNLMLFTITPDALLHAEGTSGPSAKMSNVILLSATGTAAVIALLVTVILVLLGFLNKKQKNYARIAMMAEYSSDLFIILDRENYRVEFVSNGMELAFGIPVSHIQNNYHVLDACAEHAILWPVTKLKRLGPGAKVQATEVLRNVRTKACRTYVVTAVRPKIPYDQHVMFVFSTAPEEKLPADSLRMP